MAVRKQVHRFHDGGVPPAGPDPDSPPRIELERLTDERGRETFALARRIGYRDRHLGELLVPADLDTFRTDLTSVPALFTWLVPKTGAHLPAALLHDGLVCDPDAPTYVSVGGHVVTRSQADRVFRDAMADTGTGVVRRWLIWTAVTTATLGTGQWTGWPAGRIWRYRLAVALTLLVVFYLGLCATFDLFDLHVLGLVGLPWMGDRTWWLEVVGGLAAAVVLPFLLGLTWGRFRAAGVILGIGLAVLLHVSLVLGALTLLYQGVERAADRWPRPVALVGAVGVLVAAGLTMALSLGVS